MTYGRILLGYLHGTAMPDIAAAHVGRITIAVDRSRFQWDCYNRMSVHEGDTLARLDRRAFRSLPVHPANYRSNGYTFFRDIFPKSSRQPFVCHRGRTPLDPESLTA